MHGSRAEAMRTLAPMSAGNVFQFIRNGVATTRPELAVATGMSRTTVAQRIAALIEAGLVVERESSGSTGGRPPTSLRFNHRAGVVLAADFGVTHCRVAVSSLDGAILAELADDQPIALGPDVILEWVADRFDDLLAQTDHGTGDVRGIGIGLPGPVEFTAGRAVSPPIMPGWDGVPIPARLAPRFAVPVLVDNDVNIMAVGEHRASWRVAVDDLLFVKVGMGIGCGIVVGGRLHRGAQGAAGDIGHVQLAGDETLCHCGNRGCVEAVAGGEALSVCLRELGYDCPDARGVARLVLAGNPDAMRLVRAAGRSIGEVLATLVNVFNPTVIVVGGDVAAANTLLIAGMREVVYRRSTALATRDLELVGSELGDRAGIVGATTLVLDHILSPQAVDVAASLPAVGAGVR